MKRKEGESIWKSLGKLLRVPAVVCVLFSLLVSGLVLFIRTMGKLQQPELLLYDWMIRQRSERDSTDDVIKIVGMTEGDLRSPLGFPVDDEKLAELLEKISRDQPAVIGLDMYRDLPEPRDGSKYGRLSKVLQGTPSIIAIQRLGVIGGPPALKEDPDRISANNLLKDSEIDGVYRRAPLICEKGIEDEGGGEPVPTLSLVLTMRYLESLGLDWELIEVPSAPGQPLVRLGKTVIPRMDPNAGGYVNFGMRDYSYLVDFRKPLNYRVRDTSIDRLGQAAVDTPYDYSFSEILSGSGAYRPGMLKGKIVFVATVMQSIKDSNPTPIYDNFRGVHQHAMMTRQLVDAALLGKPPMTWWPEWAEILWIVGCGMLGGMLGLWFRSPWALVPGVAILLGGIFTTFWFCFSVGIWILAIAPALSCLASTAIVTSYVVALERAKNRAVESLFSKHVSKKVAAALLEQSDEFLAGGKMASRAFRGTVIFTDLVGFSTASEKLTAEQTMKWLNEYMDVMVGIVETYDGVVNKFIGDAIMGAFGAPILHRTEEGINRDAAQAIRCALEMRRQVPILNAGWKANSPDMPPVAMRVGIFTGPLVDGSFGSAERLEWTVIGDTVNRANRLEAAGKEIKDQLTEVEKLCSILIGPETFQRVGHLFETEPVRDMALKGISERVTVYRVLAERAPS